VLVRRAVQAHEGGGAADLIADQRWIQLVEPKKQEPAFPLVRGHMVGLGGLEPPASSLSEIDT
jgi:hypothetical protein